MTTNPSPAPALDRLFGSLRRSPVSRSRDRVIAGVAGGVAERVGIAPALVRVGFVLLAIFGLGAALYFAAWLLLPAPDGRIRLERALREGDGASIVLLVVTVLALIPDAAFRPEVAWLPLVAIGGVVFFLVKGRHCGSHTLHRSQHPAQSEVGYPASPNSPAQPGPTGPDGRPQDAPSS